MKSNVTSKSQLFLRLGSDDAIPIQNDWQVSARSRANVGYDRARLVLPADVLSQAGANMLGRLVITSGREAPVVWAGYVEEARPHKDPDWVDIRASGLGHMLSRVKGTVQAREVSSPEIVYNLGLASGFDASLVEGYEPSPHPYKVSKGLRGIRPAATERIGPHMVEPLLGSDESGVVKLMKLHTASKKDAWATGFLASTVVRADTFWEATAVGGPELFEAVALLQYQWLSGSADRFRSSTPVRFHPPWRAPAVSLSTVSLVRQLDEPKAMALGRPYRVHRPRRLHNKDLAFALRRASFQARELEKLPANRRKSLLNAIHLFARAAETTEFSDALLYYSAAVDMVADVAPRKPRLRKADRDAILSVSEGLFGAADERHERVKQLMEMANQLPLWERFGEVAQSVRVRLDKDAMTALRRLYLMRNDLVHQGHYPASEIFHLFSHGLSVLDRILARLLPPVRDA